MKTLHVIIKNKIATYQKRDGDIVCRNGDYQVKFIFDTEWSAHPAKTARFIWGGQCQDVDFTGDTCVIPSITGARKCEVGVYAGDLCTTTAARIDCTPSILCSAAAPSVENDKYFANEAKRYAEEAKKAAAEQLASRPRIGSVDLLASKWEGAASPYYQVVTIEGVTENSQVDLTPSVAQLAIFHQKDLAFVTENEDGIVTVYAIGQKPENDYNIQVTMTEVVI